MTQGVSEELVDQKLIERVHQLGVGIFTGTIGTMQERSAVVELVAHILALQAALPPPDGEVAGKVKGLEDWSENDGDVVWWTWRDGKWLGEPAYIGTPLDLGQTIEIELRLHSGEFIHQHQVGGWPGYHTHWTPHPAFPPALDGKGETR